jgi:hypothetical protein
VTKKKKFKKIVTRWRPLVSSSSNRIHILLVNKFTSVIFAVANRLIYKSVMWTCTFEHDIKIKIKINFFISSVLFTGTSSGSTTLGLTTLSIMTFGIVVKECYT